MKDIFDTPLSEAQTQAIDVSIESLTSIINDALVSNEKVVLENIASETFDQLRERAIQTGYFDVKSEIKSKYEESGWTSYTEYSVIPSKRFTELYNARYNKGKREERSTPRSFKTLSIDIETYSSNSLSESGVYKYAEAEDFEILLFGYSLDFGPAEVIDLKSGEVLPDYIIRALSDRNVVKTAFNASFERTCLSKYLGSALDPQQWECTMVRGSMLGLPLSLKDVGEVLELSDKKMSEGTDLIKYFSAPVKPTKANGMRTRNVPDDDPDKWTIFKKYNRRDVEVENEIRKRTKGFQLPPNEQDLYAVDQRINDRGVMLDMTLVRNAIRMSAVYVGRLSAEAAKLTGLDNPNSVAQLKKWLSEETGSEVTTLNKKVMPDIVNAATSDAVKRLLEIRSEMGKTSIKKYYTMNAAVCHDGRVRGLLQFYGTHTGRWSGRLVQVQNLPQNHIADLDLARQIVLKGDLDELELLYGNVPDTLSQLIRTAFIAKEGCTFIVSDFSAIEARVIAWLAGEKWRLEVFKTHGKIYEASASMMYHVPVEEITKTDPRRQKGKIAELALGYQGGVGAMKNMGGEKMGLSETEMQEIVDTWREKNPAIVALWYTVQAAAMQAIEGRDAVINKGLKFSYELGAMTVRLPSGRKMYYPRAHLGLGKRSKTNVIIYEGQNQTTKKWEDTEIYGGKLVENIVQAIARDCLAVTIMRLEKLGYPIVFHVHDEIIAEVPDDGTKTLAEVKGIFKKPICWAEGLPLKGDGYVTKYYLKD